MEIGDMDIHGGLCIGKVQRQDLHRLIYVTKEGYVFEKKATGRPPKKTKSEKNELDKLRNENAKLKEQIAMLGAK